MPKLDEGAFLIQTFLPREASLDEVDRVNHSGRGGWLAVFGYRSPASQASPSPGFSMLSSVFVLSRVNPRLAASLRMREMLPGPCVVASERE